MWIVCLCVLTLLQWWHHAWWWSWRLSLSLWQWWSFRWLTSLWTSYLRSDTTLQWCYLIPSGYTQKHYGSVYYGSILCHYWTSCDRNGCKCGSDWLTDWLIFHLTSLWNDSRWMDCWLLKQLWGLGVKEKTMNSLLKECTMWVFKQKMSTTDMLFRRDTHNYRFVFKYL